MENSESRTPRVDAFVAKLNAIRIPADMNQSDRVALAGAIRDVMILWATFAREIEQDLNDSVPGEWMKEPPHRRPQ